MDQIHSDDRVEPHLEPLLNEGLDVAGRKGPDEHHTIPLGEDIDSTHQEEGIGFEGNHRLGKGCERRQLDQLGDLPAGVEHSVLIDHSPLHVLLTLHSEAENQRKKDSVLVFVFVPVVVGHAVRAYVGREPRSHRTQAVAGDIHTEQERDHVHGHEGRGQQKQYLLQEKKKVEKQYYC